jgi:hypothetical protein
MRTRLLNRPGAFEIQTRGTRRPARRETAREKDGHRDRKWAPWAAAAHGSASGQRTPDQRNSMALFGMFRRRPRTHGLRRRELLGRRNSYGQKFGSPSWTRFELWQPRYLFSNCQSVARAAGVNSATPSKQGISTLRRTRKRDRGRVWGAQHGHVSNLVLSLRAVSVSSSAPPPTG